MIHFNSNSHHSSATAISHIYPGPVYNNPPDPYIIASFTFALSTALIAYCFILS